MPKHPPPTTGAGLPRVGRFLMHYGDFHAFWSTFDVMVEILIMRELDATAEKTSIVCCGLSFGSKVNIACSLLNSRGDAEAKRTAVMLREAQQLAERNSFAHGFFLVNRETETFELLRREVRDTYHARVKEFDYSRMAHALISEKEFLNYVKDIEAHARTLASLGKPLPASPTSSAKSKKKSRP
jgi:hypothetical protein